MTTWLAGMLITAARLTDDAPTTTSSGLAAGTGFTVNSFSGYRAGNVISLDMYLNRTGADITASGGNIADTLICTVPSGWRPTSQTRKRKLGQRLRRRWLCHWHRRLDKPSYSHQHHCERVKHPLAPHLHCGRLTGGLMPDLSEAQLLIRIETKLDITLRQQEDQPGTYARAGKSRHG